jgi:TonB family protein
MTTTILEPQQGSTRLGIGLDSSRRSANADAWKRAIGTNTRVTARLGVLADTKPRLDVFGASAIAQLVLLAFLLSLPLVFPEHLKTALNYDVMPLATPITEFPVAPPPPPPPKVKPKAVQPKPEIKPAPEPPKVAKIIAPKPVKPLPPKPKALDVKQPEFKQVFEEVKLAANSSLPKRPREEVKVGNMSTGSAAPATVNLPLNKVQTGGFGDPNGIPGPGDPNKRTNANVLGSPNLPGGPGYGNGTGGATGVRGTVASTGFGNGVAVPPPSGSGKRGNVQTTGFGDATAAAEGPKKKAGPSENPTTPVNILEKPRPVYTPEGRTLRIEGDVVIEMVFLASGQVQIIRVISGLGHGLDEAAAQAAKQIKFKPAKRDGQPVDFPARVRIEFRMAY